MEGRGELLRDRAGRACADHAAVDVDDGDHFRGGARQEALVGRVEVVPRERGFAAVDARLTGQIHDGVARDAFEDPGVGGRREQHARPHDEHVVAGALGHLALVVEHQGLDAAGPQTLELRHDVVQVVERLDPGRERRRLHPLGGGGHDLQALLVELAGIEADRVGDHDHLRVRRPVGVQTEGARAAGDHEADVAVGELVGGERVVHRFGHGGLREGDLEADRAGARPQAVEVGVEPEHGSGVAAEAFEHAIAVEQTVVEHAYASLVLGHEAVVHEDDAGHGLVRWAVRRMRRGRRPAARSGRPAARSPYRA